MPKSDNFTGNLLGLQRVPADSKGTKNISDTKDTRDTRDTKDIYRLNLKLSGDLKEYLADEAWRQRISITQLVNNVLEAYKAAHPHERETE